MFLPALDVRQQGCTSPQCLCGDWTQRYNRLSAVRREKTLTLAVACDVYIYLHRHVCALIAHNGNQCCNFIYSAVLQLLTTPSDFPIPLPLIVPFAHPERSSTHSCIYPIFLGSSGTTSFFLSFRFPVDHNFCQSRSVHSLNMSKPNELFSSYVIQYRILGIHFFSNILTHFSI